MRKKFVYSCSVKNLCFRIGQTPGKHFLPPAGCGSVFPAKSFQDAWKSDSWLTRGQVNMMDEAILCSSIHSTFELLVVQPMVGCCHGEESGPFCWPMPAAHLAVFSLICWAYFSDIMASLGFRKLYWISQAADHQTVTMTFFFGACLAFRSALELLFGPGTELVITSCYIKSTFCHMSQSDQKWLKKNFAVNSYLLGFFSFFKLSSNVGWP